MTQYERYVENKKRYDPTTLTTNVDRSWMHHKQEYLRELKHDLNEFLENWKKKHPDVKDTDLNALIGKTFEDEYRRIEMLLYSFPQYAKPFSSNNE